MSSVAGLTANEWQRPEPTNPLLLVVLTAVVVAVLGLVRSRRRRWTRALTVVASAALALWMVRTIAVGAVVLAPALAHGLESLAARPSRAVGGDPGGDAVAAAGTDDGVVASGRPGPSPPPSSSCSGARTLRPPTSGRRSRSGVSAAVASLPADAGLAVDGRAVGWTQWAHRDRRPMRDLRAEVYSVPVATAYENFQEARPGWQAYADAEGITAVLADRERPLDRALSGEPAWTAVAEDPDFRLWVHR